MKNIENYLKCMANSDQIMLEKSFIQGEKAMQVVTLLHKMIQNSCPFIHAKRISSLFSAVDSLLSNGKNTLTSLGRHLKGKAKVKNKIKQIDRLLGNPYIAHERIDYYQTIATSVIGSRKEITVLIDWSPCGNKNNHILRASLASKQRSITLYEEVYPEKKLNTYSAHKKFIKNLSKLIPKDVKVLIVTDAGFQTDWFKLILSHKWDFEGRIRGTHLYSLDNGSNWDTCTSLYKKATNKAKYIGKTFLTKKNKLVCEMYLYKGKVKNKKHTKSKGKSKYKKMHKIPWLLVTSIPAKDKKASWIVKQYKKRMQIELEFRSSKNSKLGLGLNETKTLNPKRLEVLLLIGALAMFALWLIGMYAENEKLHYDYQANTIKSYRVLSLIFLGMQILTHNPKMINRQNLMKTLKLSWDY